MRVKMQKGESEGELAFDPWDIGIAGKAVDPRGSDAIDFIRSHVDRLLIMHYDEEEVQLEIDGMEIHADDLGEYLKESQGKRLILEATTLGFVEILLCSRAMMELSFPEFTLLYIEPLGYSKIHPSNPRLSSLVHRRDFALSDIVAGYRAIPGFAQILNDRRPQKVVFFLGFEAERVDRALEEQQQIQPSRCAVVIGMPPFRSGMEVDVYANNIPVLIERNIRDIHYCGAENPLAAVDLLSQIRQGLMGRERLLVAPLGTKPHGIGAALFAAANSEVGILYDHPKKKAGRSYKTSSWHLFTVELKY